MRVGVYGVVEVLGLRGSGKGGQQCDGCMGDDSTGGGVGDLWLGAIRQSCC